MLSHRLAVLLLSALILCLHGVYAYKDELKISKDVRRNFFIGNFGFAPHGKMSMNVTGFSLHGKKENVYKKYETWKSQIYFFIKITQTDFTESLAEKIDYTCDLFSQSELMVDPSMFGISQNWPVDSHWEATVDPQYTGLYSLYFINCKHTELSVSFELRLDQYNLNRGEKDYLPIGLSPLPTIYTAFSVAYVIMFVIWIVSYMCGTGNVVNKVHYLMSVLIVLKFFSLFFYAIEQHFVKIDGRPGGWEYAYCIVAALNKLFFFALITLIGTSFFKPLLSGMDKKIIMAVVPLQVLDTVAMVIVGFSTPGSTVWLTWKVIFRVVDIICCGTILIPIIMTWCIKQRLLEASQVDGKVARNLQRLRLFRQFCRIVFFYVFFTRFIIKLLYAVLQYDLIYLGDVFTELAALCVFVVVGHKFRPTQGNPYIHLEEDAAKTEEMQAVVGDQ